MCSPASSARARSPIPAQPPSPRHDQGLLGAGAPGLLAHPAVADAYGSVRDPRRLDVVADQDRSASLLARELADQVVDQRRAGGVELAGGLVRKQEARTMCQRGADRDSLKLAPGELPRPALPLVLEAHPLEKLVGPALAGLPVGPGEPELDADELPRREIRIESARVMLLDIAEQV
jgi:hypothetical protein